MSRQVHVWVPLEKVAFLGNGSTKIVLTIGALSKKGENKLLPIETQRVSAFFSEN